MSWKRFLRQLVGVLIKIAVIYWIFLFQGRVAMALLSRSFFIALTISFSFFALMIWWYIKEEGSYAISLKGIPWKMWMWTLLLCSAQYMLFSVLRGRLPVLVSIDHITTGFIMSIIGVILLVPLVEEIIFRGFLQKHLSIKLPPWLAILITSFLFALAHYETIPNILPAFLGGIFRGIIYYRTDKLILCIVYHAFSNLFGRIMQLSFNYDNLVLRLLILMLVIGLAVYSIRGIMKKTRVLIDNIEDMG